MRDRSRNSANAPATPSGAARGYLREGEGWFTSVGPRLWARDAPLQFSKIFEPVSLHLPHLVFQKSEWRIA